MGAETVADFKVCCSFSFTTYIIKIIIASTIMKLGGMWMNNIVQEMIDWIERHLSEGFSLEQLGKDMGYSPYYCSFKFHQATGMTIKNIDHYVKSIFLLLH